MSDHIERRVIAPNVDPTRTHLNRELVELPEGVAVRDEAIAHRIKSAGIKRKITPDQVRAIRVMMSGTHEDMMKIQQDGRMDEWCNDSMEWLHKTFGKENTVSAVRHMDETTPHMHLNLVPIVDRRLCAKELFTPKTLRELQSDFWEKVGKKWNLERGKPGSQAKHKSVAEYKAQKILESARNEAKNIISEADGKAQAAKLQADSIVSQAEQTAAETKQQAQEYLNGVIQSVEEEKTKPTPKKRKQAEEEIRVLRAENAALRQAKDISDHDRADLFELYQESERANKSKESVYKMVSDILSAYPDEFRTLLHKSREKKTTPYYKENSHGYDRGGK